MEVGGVPVHCSLPYVAMLCTFPTQAKIYVSERVFVSKTPEIITFWGGGTQFLGGGGEQDTTPAGSRNPLKTRPNITRATIWPTSAQDLRFRGGFCQRNPGNDHVWGGCPVFWGGGLKRAQLKGSHVSTCWNPKMSFSLRYGVTFRGLHFGHHVSERNVSTFHVSAAAKLKAFSRQKIKEMPSVKILPYS